jgi:hypothetical protein
LSERADLALNDLVNAPPGSAGNWFAAFPLVRMPSELGALPEGFPAMLRRFHPDGLHLTLAF